MAILPARFAAAAALLVASGLAQEAESPQGPQGIGQSELERMTEAIRPEVERIRGREFERPVRVAVTGRDGFLEYAKKRIEAEYDPGELEAEETAAKLLGLIPPETDLMAETLAILEGQVGGFYDPADEAFYLMSSFGGDLARIILAHELTHALDDQHYDIDGSLAAREGSTDAQVAFHAVVEGSGTAVMNRWVFDHMRELDQEALMEGASAMDVEALRDAPPYLWKPLLFPYMRGAAFLVRTNSVMKAQLAKPREGDIDRAFAEPPRSTEQVLHPEKYWDPDERDEPRPVRLELASDAGGWSVLHEDDLGELVLAMVATPPAGRTSLKGEGLALQMELLGVRYTNDAAEGWGGDRWALLGRGDARAVVSASVWDTAADADEFAGAMEGVREDLARSAAELARLRGLAGAGALVRPGPAPDEVRLAAWVGASDAEIDSLLAALRVSAEAPAGAPAGGR